ncbi:hydantoinase B/oxoprolinase family protein [Nevskia soli]|uniref:hydantoinase B/oxoprolinase family protein n=1 Tax=Nevskia soli TaxID=418856 RepID=UPI00068CAFE3|nr:hydantoinase B/oxoprolinase family protein [Nevskia soli]
MGKSENIGDQKREQDLINQFLADNVLFLGPDPEIMENHDIAPRTDAEDKAMKKESDPAVLALVRDRLQAGCNETFEMLEQMGAAPGAKWGDLITGIFTPSGDLAVGSTGGVLLFACLVHHPIKFIKKYWEKEPTVGIREGDGFIHNDARYGNIHNTDQSLIIPIFHEGKLVAWAGATVHEGENGAIEPGGMPSAAEQVYDEGLKMSPFKVVENYELKKDLVTYLQNSVREPKLQYEDMKVKLFVCRRLEQRVKAAIAEFGVDAVISSLRRGLEDSKTEVQRRLTEWPEGKVRTVVMADSTLRENCLIKINLEMEKKGDELVLDFRGSSPEFANRCNNTVLSSLKGMLCQLFLMFVWPDLPRNQAVFAPIRVICDPKSTLRSSYTTPNAESMMTFFPAFTAAQLCVAKFLYNTPAKFTKVIAPWHNMIRTFIWGGMTQHNEMVGNLCADLNGMGGGARADRDGEHAIAPIFASMADTGEQELNEEEVPFIQIVSKKIMCDNQAFGKYRGGQGYEMIASNLKSNMWGFMVCCIGSKVSSTPGLFGGYSSPTYPLCKVKGVDTFEIMKSHPEKWEFSIVDIMNKQPFEGAKYSTHHMGLQFELCNRGELYMIMQGSGGGYGDVLERDPDLVIRDIEENLISHEAAWRVYKAVFNPETLVLDRDATQKARDAERAARKKRGVPFKQFVKSWSKPEPPANIPYYGCWGEDCSTIYAGPFAGVPRKVMRADNIEAVFMPNPKDVRIAELEDRIRTLEAKGRG